MLEPEALERARELARRAARPACPAAARRAGRTDQSSTPSGSADAKMNVLPPLNRPISTNGPARRVAREPVQQRRLVDCSDATPWFSWFDEKRNARSSKPRTDARPLLDVRGTASSRGRAARRRGSGSCRGRAAERRTSCFGTRGDATARCARRPRRAGGRAGGRRRVRASKPTRPANAAAEPGRSTTAGTPKADRREHAADEGCRNERAQRRRERAERSEDDGRMTAVVTASPAATPARPRDPAPGPLHERRGRRARRQRAAAATVRGRGRRAADRPP